MIMERGGERFQLPAATSHRRAELQRSFSSQADAAHAFIWRRCLPQELQRPFNRPTVTGASARHYPTLRSGAAYDVPTRVASAIGQCRPFSTAHPMPPVRFPPKPANCRSAHERPLRKIGAVRLNGSHGRVVAGTGRRTNPLRGRGGGVDVEVDAQLMHLV